MQRYLLFLSIVTISFACSNNSRQKVDLLVFNATIYTVDSSFSTAEAMVVDKGRIIKTGKQTDLEKIYEASDQLDANGKFIYPGFIDAHAHFLGYGLSLQTVNLVGTGSWDEILEKVKAFSKDFPKDQWIVGRGWDQNDWKHQEYPTNALLNEQYPDQPVILTRIDGHAAIANQRALELAGVQPGMELVGGEVEVKNGRLTGILIDNAVDLVSAKMPSISEERFRDVLQMAEKNCFAVGLTTIDDCGLGFESVDKIKLLQDRDELKMRLYIMLSDDKKNFDYLEKKGKIKTDLLNVRGFKVYGDGALGSRGACLLEPYSDKPDSHGFLLSSAAHFDSVAAWISSKGFQMCTHAIGDSGNRTILKIYADYLKGKNDLRWRIEHAQVVSPDDFHFFGDNNIIPSVQPTHATSDMYWASERLGKERVKGAYAYKQLLKENGWIPLGTDFPVEDISPFKTFYAAVVRKDSKGWPPAGFQTENSLSREEALRGMTIWAARSNFEETEKGSLEGGKFADFVILDKDLMKTSENELLTITVIKTYLGGKKVFER